MSRKGKGSKGKGHGRAKPKRPDRNRTRKLRPRVTIRVDFYREGVELYKESSMLGPDGKPAYKETTKDERAPFFLQSSIVKPSPLVMGYLGLSGHRFGGGELHVPVVLPEPPPVPAEVEEFQKPKTPSGESAKEEPAQESAEPADEPDKQDKLGMIQDPLAKPAGEAQGVTGPENGE
jgi:hypothetical protein